MRKVFRYGLTHDHASDRILVRLENAFYAQSLKNATQRSFSDLGNFRNFRVGDVNTNTRIYIKTPETATPGKRQYQETSTPVQLLKNGSSAISIYLQQASNINRPQISKTMVAFQPAEVWTTSNRCRVTALTSTPC